MSELSNFINGQWKSGHGETIKTTNPATGKTTYASQESTADDVAGYIAEHDVPVNPLVFQGYLSVGCRPCTFPVAAGDDPRSGRWAGSDRTECGIHT